VTDGDKRSNLVKYGIHYKLVITFDEAETSLDTNTLEVVVRLSHALLAPQQNGLAYSCQCGASYCKIISRWPSPSHLPALDVSQDEPLAG
jgi:hypothetical protein